MLLLQSSDDIKFSIKNFKVVSKLKPTRKVLNNLIFAFNVCRYVKSNAIVLAQNKSTVGIGSGQPSRIDSCQIAINKMKKFVNPSKEIFAASDAFFPFTDSLNLLKNNCSCIVSPSGSINDQKIIDFADKHNIKLVFSTVRVFKH